MGRTPIDRESGFMGSLMTAAASLCLERRAMALVDSPFRWADADIAVSRFDNLQPKGDSAS